MAFDEFKKDLMMADADVLSYFKNSEEYINLKIFKVLMRIISSFMQIFLIGIIVILALVLLSLAVTIAIGEALDNIVYGFLIMGLFYALIGTICYFLRDKLNKPLLKNFRNIILIRYDKTI